MSNVQLFSLNSHEVSSSSELISSEVVDAGPHGSSLKAEGAGRPEHPLLAQRQSGLVTASLVLGIVTVIFSWLPALAYVTGAAGLALGIAALVNKTVRNRAGKAKWIAGITLSILGIVFAAAITVMVANTASSIARGPSGGAPAAEPNISRTVIDDAAASATQTAKPTVKPLPTNLPTT